MSRSRSDESSQTCGALLAFLVAGLAAWSVAAQASPPTAIDEGYARSLSHLPARLHLVGATIQAAVDAAKPGDVIYVHPGVFHENVVVATDGITIVGPRSAILDGTGTIGTSGIKVASRTDDRLHDFTLIGLTLQNYSRNGIFLRKVDHFAISFGRFRNNDEYGIFPVLSSDGTIGENDVSGSDDTGIYVGQSDSVLVIANTAHDNTTGIEIENASNIRVYDNLATHNSLGISAFILPGLILKTTSNIAISRNLVTHNNRPNTVTDPNDILSRLPNGVGILGVGADLTKITRNRVFGNNSTGIALISLPADIAALDPSIDPNPDNDLVAANSVLGNGKAPDPRIEPLPPADLLWDGSGSGNHWAGNQFHTAFPSPLP